LISQSFTPPSQATDWPHSAAPRVLTGLHSSYVGDKHPGLSIPYRE